MRTLITLSQAANRSGFSKHEIRRACLEGKLEFWRAGDTPTSPIKLEPAKLDAWVATRRNVRVLSPAEHHEVAQQAKGA